MTKIVMLRKRGMGYKSYLGLKEAMNTDLESVRVGKDVVRADIPEGTDLVLRWGYTGRMHFHGVANIINTGPAIGEVGDKTKFRLHVQRNRPNLVPKTWTNINDWIHSGCEEVIVRPRKHSKGKHVLHYTRKEDEEGSLKLIQFVRKHPGFYISEFIKKDREFRVFIVQGRVSNVCEKIPHDKNDIAWNADEGGVFNNRKFDAWHLPSVQAALGAFKLSNLDFGAVDVMVDYDDRPYVIEINSAPGLPLREKGVKAGGPTYRHECLAKCFDYIAENGKKRIPVKGGGSWKNFIHPAVFKAAIV